MTNKVPTRLDIIVCNFSPTSGHEQSGKRPALVLSGEEFNQKSGLIIICPITSTDRGNYFEVKFKTKKTAGFVLAHQVRTIDYFSRKARVVDKISEEKYREVMDKFKVILEG